MPGVLKLLKTVHDRFGSGKYSFGELFTPAIEYAERGFVISERLAFFIESEKDRLRLFPATAAVFMDRQGRPRKSGQTLRQKDLAETFRLIAAEGIEVFYQGRIAEDIVRAVREAPFHPGYLTREDMASYEVAEREPVRGFYRGYEIVGMGPPSSGGVAVLQTLGIMEHFPYREMPLVQKISLFAQAQALAFRDRNRFLGDPDWVEVPVSRLISRERAGRYGAQIDPRDARKALREESLQEEGAHTSHLSIADEMGNLVSFTTTIEHMFGSAMIVPGRGFFLNNELSDFDAAPYRPDGQLAANAPGPFKRPRSSMSPTFVFRDGRPFLAVGSPGGSRIIGIVLNILVRVLEEERGLQESVSLPRVIHRGESLELEPPYFENRELVRALREKHFNVSPAGPFGNAQAILVGEAGLTGASDPRGEGRAFGY